jgi:hypothetical protein
VFQVEAFKVNEDAANFLDHVIRHANVSEKGFSVLEGNTLHWCTSIPKTLNPSQCEVIWNGTQVPPPNTTVLNSATSSLSDTEYSINAQNYSLPVSSSTSLPVSSSISSSSRSSATLSSSTVVSSSPVASPTASIGNLSQLQSALQSLEAGAIAERPTVPTVTITVKSTATLLADSDDIHQHRKVR